MWQLCRLTDLIYLMEALLRADPLQRRENRDQ